MARPTLLNRKDLVGLFHENLRAGASIATAADSAGIGASTVYAWMARAEELLMREPESLSAEQKKFLEFREATLSARATREMRAIRVITSEIDADNWKASAWFLERAFPERWSARRSLGEDGGFIRGLPLASVLYEEPRWRSGVVKSD